MQLRPQGIAINALVAQAGDIWAGYTGYNPVDNTYYGTYDQQGAMWRAFASVAPVGVGANLAARGTLQSSVIRSELNAVTGIDGVGSAASAINRVRLRESLAIEAGIPRNIVENPSGVWGSSISDLERSFIMDGAVVTMDPPKFSGNAQVFVVEKSATGIKKMQFSPASDISDHLGQYYKITNSDGSKIKIIDPDSYRPKFTQTGMPQYDKNTVYLNPQGQNVLFDPATNSWVKN